MNVQDMAIQAGMLIFTLAAAYFLSKTTRESHLVAGILGIIAQVFWFLWLKPKDFGAYALAIGYLVIYSKVLLEALFPKRIFGVRILFKNPEHKVWFEVRAKSDAEIYNAHDELSDLYPSRIEIVEHTKVAKTKILDVKEFKEKLAYEQRIQQTSAVRT